MPARRAAGLTVGSLFRYGPRQGVADGRGLAILAARIPMRTIRRPELLERGVGAARFPRDHAKVAAASRQP